MDPEPSGSRELRAAARGGALTLVGSALSAALGFTFGIVLARLLGAHDSGVVVQAIAAFTIALSIGRIGADTCAVWILPPMVGSEPRRVRSTTALLLAMAVAGTGVLALGWWVVQRLAGTPESSGRAAVVSAMTATAPFLPAAAVMVVALAATRAFGGVLPFNLITNMLTPGLRVVLVVVVVLAGGGVVTVSLTWGLVWVAGAVAALAVLVRQMRAATPPGWGDRPPYREVLRFSLPRAVSSALEQSVIWFDVLLVGLIAGNGPAGVYGAASRFVAAGIIVSTAVRIVVAPRFSALLAQGRLPELRQLYSVTARWILVFGAPIYLGLAIYAPTVLSWLGPGFSSGVPAMVILCLGSVVVLAAGNVQSLLLMSGRSSWAAVNKSIVLAFNVVGNLILIPRIGITGAAIVWAASMLVDTVLAAWQTHRATQVAVEVREVLRTGALVAVSVMVPAGAVAWLLGQGTVSLLVAAVLSVTGLLTMAYLDRDRLQLSELRGIRGRSRQVA
ncbi:MAG: polysaccharide biosynthesis C-terminal domain-containing protein [Nocardioidaceae bacterium]